MYRLGRPGDSHFVPVPGNVNVDEDKTSGGKVGLYDPDVLQFKKRCRIQIMF